ncbi:MAG: nuclear transport factor 2 family protein [Ramlibacter sp.]
MDRLAECTRLCVDFAHHIDARRYSALLALFTEDGVLDRMGTVLRGQAEIARFLDARDPSVTTRHLCTNISIDFTSADTAVGACYVLFFQGQGAGPDGIATQTGQPAVVQYHDDYQNTPAGWRIKARRIRMAIRPNPA